MYELVFRRSGKSFFSVLAVLSVLVFVSSVIAQTTGNLQGVVRDPNGAVVAGATVKVTNTGTGQVRETTTNEDGLYRVVNLLPGEGYQIEVSAVGFSNKTVEAVVIRLATENSFDVELGVQGASGEVTVTGEAPLINSTQNQLSTSYSEKQLTQLPYNGGSIDNLALLTPGVVTPGDTDFANGVGISANGNRGRSNNFQLDGQDNNDNSVAGPSLSITNAEAIGDYQITTNNPSAEFGRNAGAQINVITKSGTNEFRGSLFEFFQNNRLNSRSNIDKQSALAYRFLANNGSPQLNGLANRNGQSVFSYNRFGGALGGPIVKNRAFFFATFQADIQNGEQDTNNLGFGGYTFTADSIRAAQSLGLPGATSILGNTNVGGGPAFANVPGTFYVVPALQDTNGDGVVDSFINPGGALTRSAFLCRVAAVNGQCPTGNLVPLLTGEAIRVAPNNFRAYQLITKEDFNITSKDTLNVRYIYDNTKFPNTAATGNLLTGASFDVPSKNNNLGVTYTRLISSTFTNEFRFNFSRLDVRFGNPDGRLPAPGISFAGQRDIATPTANFTSLAFGTANNLPQSRLVDVYQQQNTFSASLGNHFVKTGFDIRQQQVNNFFLPNFLGVYRFRNIGTNSSAVNASCPLCQFYTAEGRTRNSSTAFENLLLARPERINFALGNPRIETKQNDYFFFVQDDWRVRSNLTLNLGVRYEYSSTPFNPIIEEVNAREANAATAIFNTAFPLEFRTAKKLKTDKNNFAPRVGFAYSPDFGFLGDRFTNGKTVIRAGFGIAYDPSFFNIVLNTVTAAPFAAAGSFFAVPGVAPTGQTSPITFPFLPNTTAQLNTTPGTTTTINGVAQGGDPRLFNQTRVDPNFYNPYTMQYSVGIQQEVFKDSVLEVRFVGSRIIGQYQTINGNPDIRILNRSAQCLGLNAGAFTRGNVVGSPATPTADGQTGQQNACAGQGFNNRTGTTGNGRLDPNFGPVRLRNNGATATYTGLQARFDTRFSDIIFNANYTLSKTIDNASEIFSTFAGGQAVANSQNPFDTSVGERGLSAFHQKHNFTANFIYELPFYKDQKGVVGKLLGGYQFAGIIRLGSGRPYTPVQFLGNIDNLYEAGFFSGVGALRPFTGSNTAPNGTIAFGYEAACNQVFGGPECNNAVAGNFIVYNTLKPGSQGVVVANAQAARQQARLIYNDAGLAALGVNLSSLEAFNYFKTPYGDVGRNTLLGSNFYNVNLSMLKSFKLTERMQVELRGEATNLFNERNFGVPDAFTEDASFGNFVGSFQNPGYNTGSVRQLRFGVRFLF